MNLFSPSKNRQKILFRSNPHFFIGSDDYRISSATSYDRVSDRKINETIHHIENLVSLNYWILCYIPWVIGMALSQIFVQISYFTSHTKLFTAGTCHDGSSCR